MSDKPKIIIQWDEVSDTYSIRRRGKEQGLTLTLDELISVCEQIEKLFDELQKCLP